MFQGARFLPDAALSGSRKRTSVTIAIICRLFHYGVTMSDCMTLSGGG